jgi:UDP-N-acetylmuramate--alanine ligase
MAVISAVDADHLDIYGTYNEYVNAFEKFASLIVEGGALIINKKIIDSGLWNTEQRTKSKEQKQYTTYTYSATDTAADFHAENIHIGNGELIFDFVAQYRKGIAFSLSIKDVSLGVPVFINVENAVAAMALAHLNGVTDEEIRRGIASYIGVKRRFEKHLDEPKIFIDDYAHHPQELEQSIKSVKMLYSDKKVLGVFQPHLYSRTADFYKEFASALNLLDEIILVEIYPARELPINGVTSELIYNQIINPNKTLTTKAELLDILKTKNFDVLLTLGAGDIDTYIEKIKEILIYET